MNKNPFTDGYVAGRANKLSSTNPYRGFGGGGIEDDDRKLNAEKWDAGYWYGCFEDMQRKYNELKSVVQEFSEKILNSLK